MRKLLVLMTTALSSPVALLLRVPKLPLPRLQAPNRVPPPSRKRKLAIRTSVITAE
jgi:hypothetical protein